MLFLSVATLSSLFYAVKFIQPQLQKAMGHGLSVARVEVKTTCLSVPRQLNTKILIPGENFCRLRR